MHAGHLAILNYLRKKAFDEVRMVVSPVSPFKPGGAQTAQDRLQAVRQKVAQAERTVSSLTTASLPTL